MYADLTGFPPLLLQVGTNQVLLDDSTRLAERARDAGVDVMLNVTADVPPAFEAFGGILDEADQALDHAIPEPTSHRVMWRVNADHPGALFTTDWWLIVVLAGCELDVQSTPRLLKVLRVT